MIRKARLVAPASLSLMSSLDRLLDNTCKELKPINPRPRWLIIGLISVTTPRGRIVNFRLQSRLPKLLLAVSFSSWVSFTLLPVDVSFDHLVSRLDVPHTLPRGPPLRSVYEKLYRISTSLAALSLFSGPNYIARYLKCVLVVLVALHPPSPRGVYVRMSRIASQSCRFRSVQSHLVMRGLPRQGGGSRKLVIYTLISIASHIKYKYQHTNTRLTHTRR